MLRPIGGPGDGVRRFVAGAARVLRTTGCAPRAFAAGLGAANVLARFGAMLAAFRHWGGLGQMATFIRVWTAVMRITISAWLI